MDGITPGKTLGISEVSVRLGVDQRTVRKFVQTGRLSKGRRQGKRNVWFEADLAVYHWRLARGDFEDLPPIKDEEEDEDD